MGEFGEMITLKKKQEIILLHLREGYSQRKIASLVGVNRETVGKYIREYETRKNKLLSEDKNADTGELIQEIVEAPRYKKRDSKKRKLSKEILHRIQMHLEENVQKKQQGLRKQIKKLLIFMNP